MLSSDRVHHWPARQVFSLDWDKQYLEDEAVLREAGGFDANDMQLLDPLPPGAPLWSDLPAPPTPAADGPQPVPPEAGDDATAGLGKTDLCWNPL